MRALWIALAALAGAGCGTNFEDPAIVIDLRILGMRMTPPEIVVPFDPDNPEAIELEPVHVCALVADPGASRELAFEMVACPPTDDLRCTDPDDPFIAFASGRVDDPDEAADAVELCATLPADPRLIDVLRTSIEEDPLQGFSSVGVQIELFVKPAGGDDDDGVFGAKTMYFAPNLPAERTANTNPRLDEIRASFEADEREPLDLGRCSDEQMPWFVLASGDTVELEPVEPEGIREDYVLPTFDGGTRTFTETIVYAWFATDGELDELESGGPTDPFGNVPPIDNEWTAPEVEETTLVDLWVVQRDERGGVAWYQMCARVEP